MPGAEQPGWVLLAPAMPSLAQVTSCPTALLPAGLGWSNWNQNMPVPWCQGAAEIGRAAAGDFWFSFLALVT